VKIVEICEFYSPTGGGVRNYVHRKLQAAARCGHRLTVVAPGSDTRVEEFDGARIAWVESPGLPFDRNYRMFWRARDVWRVLDEEAPDIVEASSPWRGGWIVANWKGTASKTLFMHQDPVAVYPHTFLDGALTRDSIDRMFGWFWSYLRALNARFDATIVTGEWLARRFGSFGLERIEVIPFGIDRAAFFPGQRDLELRRQMLAACGLGADAILLIAVGRHHPEKRLRTLIEAVALAQASRPVGLTIVGDGFIRNAVESWASRVPHVHIAGRVDDSPRLAAMLASADALLHGSSAETFGLVVAEAICSGTPVVVPDSGGAADLAAPGFAETYPAGNARLGADAILRLLARNRTGLSQACVASLDERIGTVEQHFAKLFALYGTLAHRKKLSETAPVTPTTPLKTDTRIRLCRGHSRLLRHPRDWGWGNSADSLRRRGWPFDSNARRGYA
jgi:alpha-1,6-mannosyltransferase